MRRSACLLATVGLLGTVAVGAALPRRAAADTASTAADEMSAQAAAKASGQQVEALDRRTETAQVFAQPDGSFTFVDHAVPVRVHRSDGSWVPVDTTLRAASGGAVRPVATTVDLAFSAGGSGPLVMIGHGSAQLSLSWPTSLPAPTTTGDTATYPEVLPGVDLVLRAKAAGFSELLVVKSAQAAANPALARVAFGVTASGATVQADGAGGMRAVDGSGQAVFFSPKASMWDSPATGVAPAVVEDDSPPHLVQTPLQVGAGQVTVVPDQGLLTGADTHFPVFVDPDVGFGSPQWTMVDQDYPTTSYWSGSDRNDCSNGNFTHDCAKVGHYDAPSGLYRSVFMFGGTGVLAGTALEGGAYFRIGIVHSASCTASPAELHLTGPIDAGTTWGNLSWGGLQGTTNAVQNCHDSANPVPVAEASAQGAAGAAAANGWQTITLGLQESPGNERDPNLWKKFDATSAVLVVPFDRYPNKPDQLSTDNKACGGWVNSATPTMRAHIDDADTNPIFARFFWATANPDGTYTQLGWGNQDNVPSNTTAQFTIPAGQLADGGSYAWQVQVWDGFVWGPISDWCGFRLDLVPPDAPKAISSTDYPDDGQYHGGLGQAGTFVFTPPDSHPEDVAFYLYRTVDDSRATITVPAAADHSATVVITPDWKGEATLKVWTEDKAGNVSATWTSYTIRVAGATGPVGKWSFDEGTGTTAADSSGTNPANPLHLSGAAGWASHDRYGTAVSLDGTTGEGETTGPVLHTDANFTVAAWVRLSTANTNRWVTAVSQNGSQQSSFVLSYNSSAWAFALHSADAPASSVTAWRVAAPGTVQAGVWTHLAGVYDAGTHEMRLYVNGALAATGEGANPFDSRSTLDVGRARTNNSWTDWWPGQVDDVQVWDRIVYPGEIAAIADKPIPAGQWDLDDNTGTTAADATSPPHPLALTATSWVSGHSGSALHLNGTTSYGETASPVLHTNMSFTVAAWVRLTSTNTNNNWVTAVSQNAGQSSSFVLSYNGSEWAFALHSADNASPVRWRIAAGQPAQAGVWTHLAGVYDAGTHQMRLYVNGNLMASGEGADPFDAQSTLDVGRARTASAWTDWWPGDIDQVRMWAGVLSDHQIAQQAGL